MSKEDLLRELAAIKTNDALVKMLVEHVKSDIQTNKSPNVQSVYDGREITIKFNKGLYPSIVENGMVLGRMTPKDLVALTDIFLCMLDRYNYEGITDEKVYKEKIEAIRRLNHEAVDDEADSLYLIHDTVQNALKIGRSRNPQARLAQLQTANCNRLSMLYSIKGMGYLEKELHQMFGKIRLNGEWFENDGSIIKYFGREFNV